MRKTEACEQNIENGDYWNARTREILKDLWMILLCWHIWLLLGSAFISIFEYIQCKLARIYDLWSISWSTTLFRVSKKVTVLYRNIFQNCDVLLTRLKYDIIMKAKLFGDPQGTVFVFNYFLSQYKMDFFLQILFSRIKHYCREQRIVGIWLEQVCSTSYSLDLLANTYQ